MDLGREFRDGDLGVLAFVDGRFHVNPQRLERSEVERASIGDLGDLHAAAPGPASANPRRFTSSVRASIAWPNNSRAFSTVGASVVMSSCTAPFAVCEAFSLTRVSCATPSMASSSSCRLAGVCACLTRLAVHRAPHRAWPSAIGCRLPRRWHCLCPSTPAHRVISSEWDRGCEALGLPAPLGEILHEARDVRPQHRSDVDAYRAVVGEHPIHFHVRRELLRLGGRGVLHLEPLSEFHAEPLPLLHLLLLSSVVCPQQSVRRGRDEKNEEQSPGEVAETRQHELCRFAHRSPPGCGVLFSYPF